MIIYDLEIQKAIPSPKEPPVPGIQYCGGWRDHAGMGISVLAAYDLKDKRYRVFTEDNKSEFFGLVDRAELVIGFNQINFDNRVVASAWGLEAIFDIPQYDILREEWAANGLGPEFNPKTHGGYGLDALIKANFPDLGKTGHGALAPIDWQQGKIGSVIDYCLADVWLTKKIYDRIVARDGQIINPKNGRKMQLRMPEPGNAPVTVNMENIDGSGGTSIGIGQSVMILNDRGMREVKRSPYGVLDGIMGNAVSVRIGFGRAKAVYWHGLVTEVKAMTPEEINRVRERDEET